MRAPAPTRIQRRSRLPRRGRSQTGRGRPLAAHLIRHASRATFPYRGRQGDGPSKAFPFRGRCPRRGRMRYPVFRTRHVGSATPGAVVESHQSQFWNSQPPVGRIELQKATQILRAGNVLPTPRDNHRKWGPGKGDYEHEVLIWSRPRRSFGFFPIVGKVTRRPQAAKLPAKVSRRGPMRASGPTEVRKTKIAANPR